MELVMNSRGNITMVATLESGYTSALATISKQRREIVIQHSR
jgi:hypothetical protein